MFSLLDALIDQPLDEALRILDLGKKMTAALLGTAPEGDSLSCLFRLTCYHESGDWEGMETFSQRCGIPLSAIGEAYLDSTAWAQHALGPVNV